MKNILLKDWSWFRGFRLVFGLFMLYQAVTEKQTIFYIITGIMLYQAVFNIKCFGNSCEIEAPKNTKNHEFPKN